MLQYRFPSLMYQWMSTEASLHTTWLVFLDSLYVHMWFLGFPTTLQLHFISLFAHKYPITYFFKKKKKKLMHIYKTNPKNQSKQ